MTKTEQMILEVLTKKGTYTCESQVELRKFRACESLVKQGLVKLTARNNATWFTIKGRCLNGTCITIERL